MSPQHLGGGERPETEDLCLEGPGTYQGLDLTGVTARHFRMLSPLISSWVNYVLPRPLKRAPALMTFEDCDFSGLRTRWFEPGSTRFVRCVFLDVHIKSSLVNAHFIDCVFQGVWDGNISASADAADPMAHVDVAGNDFRRLAGVNFYDGVRADKNTFDDGGSQLIVRRGGPGWMQVKALATSTGGDLQTVVSSLEGRGPVSFDQDWQLLHSADYQQEKWAALVAAVHGR